MEEIKNFFIETPGLALIALGIIGFIWAITGGGLKTNVGNLPVITDSARKITYIISAIVLAVGIAIHFLTPPLSQEKKTDPVVIKDKTDTISEEQVKPLPQKFTLTGVLKDVFNNRLKGKDISIVFENTEIGNVPTDNKGIFEFRDILEHKVYTISFIDSSEKIHVRGQQPDSVFLKYVPYTGFKATICRSIEDRKPVDPYYGNNIVIKSDSLNIEPDEGLPSISCFMEILGDHTYSIGKVIVIYLDWYFNGQLVEDDHDIEAGMSTNNNGFRTWGDKKVWKGSWKLVIRTESGDELDHFFIEII